ncbi:Uncharacterised protein [Vibrio cholerae]|nr:Uncharacterised protein [Vibrio cholerae]
MVIDHDTYCTTDAETTRLRHVEGFSHHTLSCNRRVTMDSDR